MNVQSPAKKDTTNWVSSVSIGDTLYQEMVHINPNWKDEDINRSYTIKVGLTKDGTPILHFKCGGHVILRSLREAFTKLLGHTEEGTSIQCSVCGKHYNYGEQGSGVAISYKCKTCVPRI